MDQTLTFEALTVVALAMFPNAVINIDVQNGEVVIGTGLRLSDDPSDDPGILEVIPEGE